MRTSEESILNPYIKTSQTRREEVRKHSFFNNYQSLFDNNPYPFSWREDDVQKEVIQKLSSIRELHANVFSQLDDNLLVLLNQRMMKVVSCLHNNDFVNEYEISFDNYTECCLDVRFKKRPDMVLNVYFDEPNMINNSIQNVEVAYLSYKNNGQRQTINNTLDYILHEMLKLL